MSANGPAVVIGAGNIGCGLAAEQLVDAGQEVVLVTRTASSAASLSREGVRLRYTGDGRRPDRLIRPDLALPSSATEEVVRQIARASVVLVTVGPSDQAQIAPTLAAGLMARRTPVNVVVCDNREGAAENLRALVAEHGDDRALRHGFVGGLVDRIVTSRQGAGPQRLLVAEAGGRLYVDAPALRAPLPALAQLRLVERFRPYVLRKLFVFSAGHAASAYLGALRGRHLLRDALSDPEVSHVVRAAMREGQAGLAACFGDDFAGGADEVEQALDRFANPALDDTVDRVGRDPLRKLGARDRVCGPARLAMAAGHPTPALALVAAAALSGGGGDPALRRRLERHGPARVLADCGQLPSRSPFIGLAVTARRLLATSAPLPDVLALLAAGGDPAGGHAGTARLGARR